ncbi:MAG TPA: hypothetical protein VH208_10205, partial [Myxococcaceae bacterium]|nr:hypothetical protein [Myxococcaceae bacterium]
MSDTQAAMREFRFLDDKRRAAGLSATEEQRWAELRQALGIQDAPAQDAYQQQQGYYAEDGNWYPYPAGYDPNAYYDPNQYPQGYAEGQQGYDPNQAYYAQQGYDPNAANPEGYDPNQPAYYPQGYDPNQQPYDPNAAGYDPNGQYAADPNAAWADQQQQSAASLLSLGPEDGLEVPPPAESSWVPPSPVAVPTPAPAPLAPHEEEGPLEVDASEVMEVSAEDVTPIEGDSEHHLPPAEPPAAVDPALGTFETPALEFNAASPAVAAAEPAPEAPLEFSDDGKLPLPAQEKSPWFNLPSAAAEAEPEAVTSSMIATPSMSMSLAEPAVVISSNIAPAAPQSSPTVELSPELEAAQVELASASEFVQYQRTDDRSIDLADSGSPSDPPPLELEAEPSAQAVAEASERVPLASAADFLDMPELTSTGHQGAPEPPPATQAPEKWVSESAALPAPPASSPPPAEEPAEWEQPRPPTPSPTTPMAAGPNPLDSHLPGFDISAPVVPAEIPP